MSTFSCSRMDTSASILKSPRRTPDKHPSLLYNPSTSHHVYLWSRKSCWIHTLKAKTLSFGGRVPALCLAENEEIIKKENY